MTERWENELQRLARVQMPDRVRLRTEDGPSGEGMPPRSHRVVAAIVAFAVFVVAGAFAWRAFRPAPATTLGGGTIPTASVTLLARGPEFAEAPYAEISFDGRTVEGQVESFQWQTAGGVSMFDAVAPEFRDPLQIGPETLIEVHGDADSVSGRVAAVAAGALFPWNEIEELDLRGGSVQLQLEPGSYALAFTAYWEEGNPTFWFPIEVVDATGAVEESSVDGAVVEVTREPIGAMLSFGDQVQEGIVTDVWDPTGDIYDAYHRVALPNIGEFPSLVRVPAGASLDVIGEIDGWTVFPQPGFDVVRLTDEPGPAVFAVRTGWHGVAFDVAFGIKVVDPTSGTGGHEASEPSGTASDRLVVSCEGETPVVATPVVSAKADGVHVVLDDVPGDVSVRLASVGVPGVEWHVSPSERFPVALPAGDALVSCDRDPIVTAETKPTASITVVADSGFVPFALDCPIDDQQRLVVSEQQRQVAASIEGATRIGLPGIRSTDVVEPAGYVEQSPWLFARLIREERIVAWFLVDGREGWRFRLLHATACAGTDVGQVDPDQDGQIGFG